MKEILPGIFHWTATHPEIGVRVSSYYLADDGVLLDPLVPDEGIGWFEDRRPRDIILTNRLHERESAAFRQAFGCRIRAHRAGIEQGIDLDDVEPFEFGSLLPGKIQVLEVNAICPEEAAFHIARGDGILALADGLIRSDEGDLSFVDDSIMAESPAAAVTVKAGLSAAFRNILNEHLFENLFFAHGDPLMGRGRVALRDFLEAHSQKA